MNDGRVFTDYRPNCEINTSLQQKTGVKNSHEFRKYLQDNGEEIMKRNREANRQDCSICPVCQMALDYKPHQK